MYSELRQTMCSVKDGIEKEYKLVLAYLFWSAICTYWGVWNACGILEFYGMEAVRLDSEGDTDQLGQPEQRLLRLYGRTERRLLPHRGSRHFLHVCDQDDDPLCTDRYFHVVSEDPDPAVGSARIGGRAGEGRGNPGFSFPFFLSAQHLAGACDIYRACAGRNRCDACGICDRHCVHQKERYFLLLRRGTVVDGKIICQAFLETKLEKIYPCGSFDPDPMSDVPEHPAGI